MRVIPVAGLLIGVSLLTVACSSTLDEISLADQIRQGIADQVGGDYAVTCPSGMAMSAGTAFSCDAVAPDGTVAMVAVTVVDDAGNVEWELLN